MNFLLDMGLSPRTAAFLRNQNFDAIHLREQGLQRLSDEAIVQKALSEQRVILTHDLDFGRIVSLSKHQYPSVVTFRLSVMQADVVHRYLQEVIYRFSSELMNGALISVTDLAMRVRQLPIR